MAPSHVFGILEVVPTIGAVSLAEIERRIGKYGVYATIPEGRKNGKAVRLEERSQIGDIHWIRGDRWYVDEGGNVEPRSVQNERTLGVKRLRQRFPSLARAI